MAPLDSRCRLGVFFQQVHDPPPDDNRGDGGGEGDVQDVDDIVGADDMKIVGSALNLKTLPLTHALRAHAVI